MCDGPADVTRLSAGDAMSLVQEAHGHWTHGAGPWNAGDGSHHRDCSSTPPGQDTAKM